VAVRAAAVRYVDSLARAALILGQYIEIYVLRVGARVPGRGTETDNDEGHASDPKLA